MRRPISIVAERAVRYLRDARHPVDSVRLAHDVLATKSADEPTATRVLEAAFQGDDRLKYTEDGWVATQRARSSGPASVGRATDPPRVLLVLEGGRPRGRP